MAARGRAKGFRSATTPRTNGWPTGGLGGLVRQFPAAPRASWKRPPGRPGITSGERRWTTTSSTPSTGPSRPRDRGLWKIAIMGGSYGGYATAVAHDGPSAALCLRGGHCRTLQHLETLLAAIPPQWEAGAPCCIARWATLPPKKDRRCCVRDLPVHRADEFSPAAADRARRERSPGQATGVGSDGRGNAEERRSRDLRAGSRMKARLRQAAEQDFFQSARRALSGAPSRGPIPADRRTGYRGEPRRSCGRKWRLRVSLSDSLVKSAVLHALLLTTPFH